MGIDAAKDSRSVKMNNLQSKNFTATTNACKLCMPLGASLFFKGIESGISLLHGSQGCSTYIRRYLISHFREPVDIASSNFSEDTAIFGGGANLKKALDNIIKQYRPGLIGVASTCLSETIGDDVPMLIRKYIEEHKNEILPRIVHVSTPSYSGTHAEGFHRAVKATVENFLNHSQKPFSGMIRKDAKGLINLFPGMVSPADLRYLKQIMSGFGLSHVMLPDYSESLDGGLWSEFEIIQGGGARLDEISSIRSAMATLELGRVLSFGESAGHSLEKEHNIKLHSLGLPIGVKETDMLFSVLEKISGEKTPDTFKKERDRLIDSYVDGHKYVSQIKAVVYGEEDLVVGLVSFLREIGIIPVLAGSGGQSKNFKEAINQVAPDAERLGMHVREGVDFMEIEEAAKALSPDIVIGNSKGYGMARRLKIPLVRVGFPIHDRLGGPRVLHLGYRGAQQLFDRIVNSLLENSQDTSETGYAYM
jgi:nitrogenase molybdenum-iron protein NifN